MDKELKEKMDKLLDMMLDKVSNTMGDVESKFENALKEPCKIHIDNDGKGGTGVEVEGKRLSLLLTLAGAEKNILKELNCSTSEFEIIKNFVGTEEVNDNE